MSIYIVQCGILGVMVPSIALWHIYSLHCNQSETVLNWRLRNRKSLKRMLVFTIMGICLSSAAILILLEKDSLTSFRILFYLTLAIALSSGCLFLVTALRNVKTKALLGIQVEDLQLDKILRYGSQAGFASMAAVLVYLVITIGFD